MGEEDVAQLIAEGIVRRCERDPESALAAARLDLESAATLAESDPNGAFQLAYDGTRTAIGAHMRARGLRVGSGAGAQLKTGRYAQAALGDAVERGLP